MDALTTPSNWQRVRLGDVAEINPPTIIPNVFYYIDLESVEKGQLLNKQLMTKNKAPSRARRLLSKNDILYQLVRPYQRNNYFFTLNGNYVASTGYAQIRTLQNPSFLYFALHSNYFVNAVLDRCEGTSYPAISSNELKKCEVILPPLNEQAAIANILSDVDHYLYSLDALILKKESVKKALSFELLSQRKRLKGFNQAWQRVRLGDIANYLTSNLSAEQITQQGKIKVYDVNNFIGYTDTTFISDKPYISIVKDGSVGRVRILPPKTNILSTMGALVANHKTTTEFLFYLLSNFDFKNFTSGSIIPHIYFKDYKEKTIFLPSLDEQAAIANILSGLDHEIISLKNKKRQFDNIKKALNHDLMSAKIRVLKK
ncbi:restriction endonuclease subunit S [Helicobacter pylori]|uniref:restriction endonuclease subunit S n=1 Tax=Helicobacter pylori TaxID=210 RepID=UPI0012E7CAD8|nr:restriction endonuclease subunit S [Helicobacter pylori]MUU44544.1 restriction endonuclease subunit S [Helicobacter pylori]